MNVRLVCLVLALIALLSTAIGGYFFNQMAKTSAHQEAVRESLAQTAQVRHRVSTLISYSMKDARLLARFAEIKAALVNSNDRTLAEANSVLDTFAADGSVDVCYLVDRSGRVIASSNRNATNSFVGKDYSSLPYFASAIQGNPSMYIAWRVTPGKRGLYCSHPVYLPDSEGPIGVTLVKSNVVHFEEVMHSHPGGISLLVDKIGMVLVSTREDWAWKLLWKPSPEELAAIEASGKFGQGPWQWTGLEERGNDRVVDSSGERYLLEEKPIRDAPQWRIVHLHRLTAFSGTLADPLRGTTGYLTVLGVVLVAGAVIVLFWMGQRDIHRRSQVEEELRETEERYRTFFDTSRDCVFMTRLDGRFVDFNDVVLEVFGYGPHGRDELLRKNVTDAYASPEQGKAYVELVLNQGFAKEYPLELLKKDGTTIHTLVTTVARRDRNGKVIGFQGTVRDITDRKKAEDALRKSESFLNNVIDQSPYPMWISDHQGTLERTNQSLRELLHISDEEVVGKYNILEDNIVAEQGALPLVKNVFEQGHTARFELTYDSSQLKSIPLKHAFFVILDVTVFPIMDVNGRILSAVIQHIDITDRKQAEQALRASNRRLEESQRIARIGTWEWNPVTDETYWSDEVYRIFGLEPGSERPCYELAKRLTHPEDTERWQKAVASALKSEHLFRMSYKAVKSDGSVIWIQNEGEIIRDPEGKAIRILGTAQDVTDRKKVEEALRESEDKFRIIVENSHDVIFSSNAQGEILYLSPSIEKVMGYKPAELIGTPFRSLVHPDDLPAVQDVIRRNIQEGYAAYRTEYRVRSASGEWRWHEAQGNAVRNERGEFIYYTGLARDVTEQKQAIEALKISHHRLDQLIEFLPDPTIVIDANGRVEAWNRAMEDLTGISAKSIVGQGNFEYALPFYGERRPILLDLALHWENGYERKYLSITERDDGVLISESFHPELKGGIFISATARALYDAEGRAVGAIETLRDITRVKMAENALAESERRLAQIIEFLPDATMVVDTRGTIIAWNEAMKDLTGVDASAMIGKGDREYAIPFYGTRRPVMLDLVMDHKEEVASTYVSCHREGTRLVSETCLPSFRDKGPTWLWNVAAPLYDQDGNVVGAIEAVRDITDRKHAEEALKTSEEKYRTVVQESFDGVFVQKGKMITFANARLHEMLGYDRGELEGLDHWVVYHPDYQDLTRSRAQARLRGESVTSRYEVHLQRKDGTSFPGEISAKVIQFDNEPGIQVWIRDLTEQKLLEQRLVEAQKMEAIGTLTGGIAHDFNNLLTVINGFTELIISEKTEDDPAYSDLQKIMETGRKGAAMVQRLLAFGKKAESSPQPLNLNRVIENSVDLMESTFPKMIEIVTELADDLGTINADASQIEQAFMNLCINAQEAMPQGGRLRIETGNTLVDEDYCRLHPGARLGQHVVVEISDTGGGMNKEMMGRIFDPFFTTKGWDSTKGTGLGLSVAKGIVEQNGGWITCQSEPVKGSTFKLYFPIIEVSGTAGKPEPPTETISETKQILLVDDEEHVRALGKRILERAGHKVISAANGKEALEIYAGEESRIGLVILDLIMPQMGGEKCLEGLLTVNPNVKVIISTGHSFIERERDSPLSRATGFINKPYRIQQLLEVVRDALACTGGES